MHLFCIHIIYIWVVIKVVGIKNNIKTCYLGLVMPMTDKVTVMIPCYHFNCNS